MWSFVGVSFEAPAVFVEEDEQFEPGDAWGAPVREVPFVVSQEVSNVLKCVLVFIA